MGAIHTSFFLFTTFASYKYNHLLGNLQYDMATHIIYSTTVTYTTYNTIQYLHHYYKTLLSLLCYYFENIIIHYTKLYNANTDKTTSNKLQLAYNYLLIISHFLLNLS